jgi:hypothetical protein
VAERPVFVPAVDVPEMVTIVSFQLPWHPGFSIQQKRRNVSDLHAAAARSGCSPVLEVSTKSEEPLGQHLSAFSLKVNALLEIWFKLVIRNDQPGDEYVWTGIDRPGYPRGSKRLMHGPRAVSHQWVEPDVPTFLRLRRFKNSSGSSSWGALNGTNDTT